jgi:hypothetical protein
VTVGTFTAGGLPSIVALNPGSNTFGVLTGLGGERFANATVFPTSASGLVVRAIDLGNGVTGLAILTPDGLYIEPSDGFGGFLPAVKIDVGFEPNGLTVANLDGSGSADLLVSNPLGDVQVLLANGNGTFTPPHNLDRQVAMTAIGPNLLTPDAFIFSDKLTDQLVVRTAAGVTTVLGDASTGLVSPGAIALADLNGDGILDLILANSGSNNILIYTGLANGGFGPAVNGGHGYFSGTNPVGITVYDVDGNSRPDLIIANKGSNDVAVLINKSVGNAINFVPGPRLQTGVGPVATVVADVYGNGVPDLVVANSGSNNVMVLPSIGNGFFNDQNPTTYAVGTSPTSLFVGNFTGGAGQDIATINSGSNTVSLVSNLGSAAPVTQSISSGGIDPEAAFVVPGTSATSLVVANSGNGSISLFEGGENGLTLSSTLTTSGLPNPSALALASFNSSGIQFWTTNDGEQNASLLNIQLEASAAETSSGASASPTLLSLNASSLALVGTFLTVTLDLQTETSESSEGTAALVAAASGSAGQSLTSAFGNTEDNFGEYSELANSNGAQPPSASAWSRYVTGVDQAIERVRSEADERLLEEKQPSKGSAPGTTLLEQGGGATEAAGTATFVEEAAFEAGRRLKAERDRFDAIDNTLGAWSKEVRIVERFVRVIAQPAAQRDLATTLPQSTADQRLSDSATTGRLDQFDNSRQIGPAVQDDHANSANFRVSRMVALAAFSATALATGEGLFRRSRRKVRIR